MGREENELTVKIIQILKGYGHDVWRQNNIHTPGRAFIGRLGATDVTGITRHGFRLDIEIKAQGKKPGKEQQNYGQAMLSRGGAWMWCDSIDSFLLKAMEMNLINPGRRANENVI